MEYIRIYHGAQAVSISKDFADLVGLKHGQHINNQQEFSALMVAYCKHEIKKCEALIAAEKNLN